MFGLETANLTLTSLRVSQAALNLSDNASRMGQAIANSTSRTVYESDVNQMLTGLGLQAGDIEILERGRVILSSWSATVMVASGSTGSGARGRPIISPTMVPKTPGQPALPLLEWAKPGMRSRHQTEPQSCLSKIIYEHEPLFGDLFYQNKIIRHEAVFNIRDNRNLGAGVVADGEPAATCNLYTST